MNRRVDGFGVAYGEIADLYFRSKNAPPVPNIWRIIYNTQGGMGGATKILNVTGRKPLCELGRRVS